MRIECAPLGALLLWECGVGWGAAKSIRIGGGGVARSVVCTHPTPARNVARKGEEEQEEVARWCFPIASNAFIYSGREDKN